MERRKRIRVGWRKQLSCDAVSTKASADPMDILKMGWPFYWGQGARALFPCIARAALPCTAIVGLSLERT